MTNKRFKVALSFPGEQRDYVLQVAELLVSELGKEAVFYDNWYKAELSRIDLMPYLQDIYHQHAHLIIPFLCADYERKEWCGLELLAILDLIKQRKYEDIMPMRFDDAKVTGFYSNAGYIDLRDHSPQETAEFILQRLKLNGHNVTTQIKAVEKTEAKIIATNNQIVTPVIKPYQDWQTIGKYKVKDGLAIDTKTNLMWLRFAYGQEWRKNTALMWLYFAYGQEWQNNTAKGESKKVNWQTAFEVAKEFNKNGGYANYSDWRLPTIEELKTLIDKEKGTEGNYIDADVFPNNARWFWSSSPVAKYSGDDAWIVDFYYGVDSWYDKDDDNFVRLVRGGQ